MIGIRSSTVGLQNVSQGPELTSLAGSLEVRSLRGSDGRGPGRAGRRAGRRENRQADLAAGIVYKQ
jgi:hypothetical protein